MAQNTTLFPKIKVNIKNPPISGVNLGNYKFDGNKLYLQTDDYVFAIEPNEENTKLLMTYKDGENDVVSESIENIIKGFSSFSEELSQIKYLIESLDLQNIVTKENLSNIIKVKMGDEEPTALNENTIVIPMATEDVAGLVKIAPTEKENGVSADDENILTVNSVSFEKIKEDEGTEILFQSK